MWNTQTYWFDVAIVTTVLMFGQLCFGRFSEYQPRGLRALKSILGVVLIVGASAWLGRQWLWILLGVVLLGLLVVHGWMLPRKGVNGWTMEPRERYYELMKLDSTGRPRS